MKKRTIPDRERPPAVELGIGIPPIDLPNWAESLTLEMADLEGMKLPRAAVPPDEEDSAA